MKKLFLDIETLPAEELQHGVLEEIYKKKTSEGKKVALTFESFLKNTAFDGTFGRIFCISVAVNDEPAKCLSGDEKKILEDFWDIAKDVDLFVGHNIFDFDLRFILQRSVILGVKPTKTDRELSFARYRNEPIFDTMYEWSKWNTYNKISLDMLARALGLPSPKEGELDGSRVYEYYKKGKFDEICNYCNADVEVTRQIYKKMTFS